MPIVSHLLLLWARHRWALSAARSLFVEAVQCFKPKLMMSPSWMFSVCWWCNHIEVASPRTQHQDTRVPIKSLYGLLFLQNLLRTWVISLGCYFFGLSPIILLTTPAVILTQIDRWRSSGGSGVQSFRVYRWVLVCVFENPDFLPYLPC